MDELAILRHLRELSTEEMSILRLRCHHQTIQQIDAALHLGESQVLLGLARLYEFLGLAEFSKAERWSVLLGTVALNLSPDSGSAEASASPTRPRPRETTLGLVLWDEHLWTPPTTDRAEPPQTAEPTCPQCNAHFATDTSFCPVCGEKLVRRCPSCWTTQSRAATFCSDCGVALPEARFRIPDRLVTQWVDHFQKFKWGTRFDEMHPTARAHIQANLDDFDPAREAIAFCGTIGATCWVKGARTSDHLIGPDTSAPSGCYAFTDRRLLLVDYRARHPWLGEYPYEALSGVRYDPISSALLDGHWPLPVFRLQFGDFGSVDLYRCPMPELSHTSPWAHSILNVLTLWEPFEMTIGTQVERDIREEVRNQAISQDIAREESMNRLVLAFLGRILKGREDLSDDILPRAPANAFRDILTRLRNHDVFARPDVPLRYGGSPIPLRVVGVDASIRLHDGDLVVLKRPSVSEVGPDVAALDMDAATADLDGTWAPCRADPKEILTHCRGLEPVPDSTGGSRDYSAALALRHEQRAERNPGVNGPENAELGVLDACKPGIPYIWVGQPTVLGRIRSDGASPHPVFEVLGPLTEGGLIAFKSVWRRDLLRIGADAYVLMDGTFKGIDRILLPLAALGRELFLLVPQRFDVPVVSPRKPNLRYPVGERLWLQQETRVRHGGGREIPLRRGTEVVVDGSAGPYVAVRSAVVRGYVLASELEG